MWFVIALVLFCIGAYVLYEALRITRLIRVSSGLVKKAVPYQRAAGTHSLLVLGDSTAVGVGARAEKTVAAYLGEYLDASVENYAVSGAVAADLMSQLHKAQKPHYDYVHIQIGANDIIRARSLEQAAQELEKVLTMLTPRAERITLLTAGKVGDAPLFPLVARPLLNARAAALRKRFMALAAKHGVAYVDLYTAPIGAQMNADPQRYYAPDGLHLTGEGYKLWYEHVKDAIESHWPA